MIPPPRSRRNLSLAASLLIAALAGCQSHHATTAQTPAATQSADPRFPPIVSAALPNAHRLTDKVIAGGLPDGERGFEALESLGVKTVIDVDGLTPQVELAHAHGMRYVHLPIGYDGVPTAQGEAIAKAITELPGPVYVHCHHGQHRGPAGAVVGCVENGTLPPDEAEAALKTFGTGANYVGLWASARAARPLNPSTLVNLHVHFVERAKLPPLADAMVKVDDAMDALKAARKSRWPANAPAGGPAHGALMLEELLVEVGRSNAGASKPEEFQSHLQTAIANVRALRGTLAAQPLDATTANVEVDRVAASCTACHKTYRDVKFAGR